MTVKLYASATGTLDPTAALLATASRKVSLRPAAKTRINVPVNVVPAALTAGRYTLIAQVTDPAGQTSATAAGPVVTAASPFVSLSASAVKVTPVTVHPGKTATLTLTLSNGGNVATTGTAAATISLSVGATTQATTLATLAPRPRIKPGGHARLALRFRVPANQAAGVFVPSVTLTANGSTATAAGATPFTVG